MNDDLVFEQIKQRLRNLVLEHPVLEKVIKGIDRKTYKITVEMDNQIKLVTIDELENMFKKEEVETLDDSMPTSTNANEEVLEVMDESPVQEVPQNNIVDFNQYKEQKSQRELRTLQELKEAIDTKDIASIDNALEKIAKDEKTNKININKAIVTITNNSMNNVINSVRDKTILPNDLNSYDISGKITTAVINSQEELNPENLTNQSFNNILLYVDVAKLKGTTFTEQQIANAKNKYATAIHDKMNIIGLNKAKQTKPVTEEKQSDNIVDINEYKEQKEQAKTLTKGLRPDTNIKKTGFADILVLTIIVLIYAAIIINLVTKLK